MRHDPESNPIVLGQLLLEDVCSDLIVTLRPLDNARLGVIGDCLNIAARLLPVAGPGEIVVSHVFQQALRGSNVRFAERPPLDAKNVGMIQPWQMTAVNGQPA